MPHHDRASLDGLAPIDAVPHRRRDGVVRHTTCPSAFPDKVDGARGRPQSATAIAIQLVSIRHRSIRGRVPLLAHLVVTGQPHPNEPIGMATIMAMCEYAAVGNADVLEATGVEWHFVPDADPDGTRLNEGWFDGPWTREHYARTLLPSGRRSPGRVDVSVQGRRLRRRHADARDGRADGRDRSGPADRGGVVAQR